MGFVIGIQHRIPLHAGYMDRGAWPAGEARSGSGKIQKFVLRDRFIAGEFEAIVT